MAIVTRCRLPAPLHEDRRSSSGEFVKAQRHCLAKVHGRVRIGRGDAHQPVTVAQIVVREAEFLGAEQKRDGRSRERAVNQAPAVFQAADGVV